MIFGYIYFPHCVLVVGGGVWHIYLRSSCHKKDNALHFNSQHFLQKTKAKVEFIQNMCQLLSD